MVAIASSKYSGIESQWLNSKVALPLYCCCFPPTLTIKIYPHVEHTTNIPDELVISVEIIYSTEEKKSSSYHFGCIVFHTTHEKNKLTSSFFPTMESCQEVNIRSQSLHKVPFFSLLEDNDKGWRQPFPQYRIHVSSFCTISNLLLSGLNFR